MGEPSFLGIKLLDVTIIILVGIVIFTLGRMYGYHEKERELKNEREKKEYEYDYPGMPWYEVLIVLVLFFALVWFMFGWR